MAALQSYQHLLETSRRVNWHLEDLVGEGRRLDFTRPFLPETFAQTEPLGFLSPAEKLKLNQIRARGYLALFELLEAFVVPFISAQADDGAAAEPFRAHALRHFACEEEKHRQLFSTGTVKDNQDLDPQFRSLLKHHWIEEAQHARLDGLVLKSHAQRSSAQDIATAIQEYFEIGAFLDAGFKQQAELDLKALERAIRRTLSEDERRQIFELQHRALCWTFLGSAMENRNFLAALASISDDAAARVEQAAKSFIMH